MGGSAWGKEGDLTKEGKLNGARLRQESNGERDEKFKGRCAGLGEGRRGNSTLIGKS